MILHFGIVPTGRRLATINVCGTRRPSYHIAHMKLRRISSTLTFFYKFLFPAFLVVGFVGFVWRPGTSRIDPKFDLLVLAASVLVVAYEMWITWPIKRVLLDAANQRLYVSNYRREIVVPLSDIAHVTEFTWHDPRRITLYLRTPCEFGDSIAFLATYQFGGWLAGEHPIVKELRELAAN